MSEMTRWKWARVGLVCVVLGLMLTLPRVWAAPAAEPIDSWYAASNARIAELWAQIEQRPVDAETQAELAELQQRLARYKANETERRAEIHKAFDEYMADMAESLGDDDLPEALSDAVLAQGLTDDPKVFLKRRDVADLILRAEAAASVAEASSKWFDALVLYRRLDLLIDDHATYDQPLRRVARKLRILRLYVPDTYYKLSDDFAISQGEEPGERWEGDEQQGWRHELRGVNRSMLLQAMTRASDNHVEGSSYDRLFIGGVDGLRIFCQLEPLGAEFAGLKNDAQRQRFLDYLDAQRNQLVKRTRRMTYTECANMLREALTYNRQTVRLPDEVFVHEFAAGAMATLDEFSSIYWPSEKERFERTTKQQFVGVGVQITLTDDELTIVSPLEDTPAHRAGLKAGDRICTIDGSSTTGISLNQAVRAITGESKEGSAVVLGIRTPGTDNTRQVTLVRERIKIVSVKGFQHLPGGAWDFIIDPDLQIGFVRVTQFGPDTAAELDRAIESMRECGGVRGLILDLRFNGGGRLDAAVALSNRFVDDGKIVTAHRSHFADAKDTYEHFPLVVLINRGSASASEILAGCLQDHHRALIVGENTYGKGSVQEVAFLGAFEAYLKVTTTYYKLPSGRIIHRRPKAAAWGVQPDVVIRMTDSEVERLIRARMYIDIFRENDEAEIDPDLVVKGPDEPGEQDQADAADEEPLPTTAAQLLAEGYDPQLEAGLLLLKAQLLNVTELVSNPPDNTTP